MLYYMGHNDLLNFPVPFNREHERRVQTDREKVSIEVMIEKLAVREKAAKQVREIEKR